MARRRRRRVSKFDFQPFSAKQIELIEWWREDSEHYDKDMIIADGAIRSGKTIAMICGFMWWSLIDMYDGIFIIAGRSMGALKRNVIEPLLQIVSSWGLDANYNRSENVIWIGKNTYYLFGAPNQASQDTLQGLTASGAFVDEVALLPRNFVDQMIARCSVSGSRIWMNCNPEYPSHWFKTEYIDKAEEKQIAYLKFNLEDNLTLSEEIKERYRRMYTGVFFVRNILGKWVAAAGAIYTMLASQPERYTIDEVPEGLAFGTIGIDFGGNKSGHAFCFTGFKRDFSEIVTLHDHYRDGIIDPDQLANDFVVFVRECRSFGIPIIDIRADSAEQVLIAGLQKALINAGLPYEIKNSIKGPIIDRIRLYNMLLAQGRWKIMRACESTLEAFSSALYDDKKKEDVRLDDGTIRIDPIDAQEYSTEPFQEALLAWGYGNGQTMVGRAGLSPSTAVR